MSSQITLCQLCWGDFCGAEGDFSHFISCDETHNYISVICKAISPSLSVFDSGCLTMGANQNQISLLDLMRQ